MNEEIKDYTSSGKIKRPSYSLVANWVKESWDAVDSNMIKRSFKCCGVSNATNGEEDSLIFNFNKVENINNPERGVEDKDDSESESGGDDSDSESGSEDNGSESDSYYEKNEELNVTHDWN
jgi:hypothetical protein